MRMSDEIFKALHALRRAAEAALKQVEDGRPGPSVLWRAWQEYEDAARNYSTQRHLLAEYVKALSGDDGDARATVTHLEIQERTMRRAGQEAAAKLEAFVEHLGTLLDLRNERIAALRKQDGIDYAWRCVKCRIGRAYEDAGKRCGTADCAETRIVNRDGEVVALVAKPPRPAPGSPPPSAPFSLVAVEPSKTITEELEAIRSDVLEHITPPIVVASVFPRRTSGAPLGAGAVVLADVAEMEASAAALSTPRVLLPCPRCNGTPIPLELGEQILCGACREWFVACPKCYAAGHKPALVLLPPPEHKLGIRPLVSVVCNGVGGCGHTFDLKG